MPHIEARNSSLIYDTPSGTVPGMAPDVFSTALSPVEVNPGFPDLKTLVAAKTINAIRTGARHSARTLWKKRSRRRNMPA
jgi:hypothetical protein